MAAAGVLLKLSNTAVQLMPGESSQVTINLTNQLGEVERFELQLADIDPGWYNFDRSFLLLYPDAPGNEGSVVLQINIPGDLPPGSYTGMLNVYSPRNSKVVASQQLIVLVGRQGGEEVYLNPLTQVTREKQGRYELSVKHSFYYPVTVNLQAQAYRAGMQVQIMPPALDIPPYSEGRASVLVKLKRSNWIGRDQHYAFRLMGDTVPVNIQAELIQTCRLPWLRRLLLAPLFWISTAVAAVVIALAFWYLSQGTTVLAAPGYCVVPSSSLVATLRYHGATTDIVVSQPDGSNPQVIKTESSDRLPGIYQSLLSISPDGKWLAYVTADNSGMDKAAVQAVNLQDKSVKRINGVLEGYWPTAPVWSKDSNKLAFIVRTQTKLTVEVASIDGTDQQAQPWTAPDALVADLFYGNKTPKDAPVCWSDTSDRIFVITDNTHSLLFTKGDGKGQPVDHSALRRPGSQTQVGGLIQVAHAQEAEPVQEPALAPVADGECAVINFSENDPKLYDLTLQNRGDKLREAGCPLVAAAMVLNYNKMQVAPDSLNECLTARSAPKDAAFDWTAPLTTCPNQGIQGGDRLPFSWATLDQTLKRGQPAVVGLLGGQSGFHFVVVTGGYSDIASTYRVNDPWDGTSYKSLGYFISLGYQLQWIISYNSANAPACTDRTQQGDANSVTIKVQGIQDGGLYRQPVQISYSADNGQPVKGTLIPLTLINNAPKPTNTTPTNNNPPVDNTSNFNNSSNTNTNLNNGNINTNGGNTGVDTSGNGINVNNGNTNLNVTGSDGNGGVSTGTNDGSGNLSLPPSNGSALPPSNPAPNGNNLQPTPGSNTGDVLDGGNVQRVAFRPKQVGVDTSSLTSYDLPSGSTVQSDGVYLLVLETGSDPANRQRVVYHFVIDRTPPDISFNKDIIPFEKIPGPLGQVNLGRSPFPLQFVYADYLSRLATLEYSKDGGRTWFPYANDAGIKSTVITTSGEYVLVYRAKDGAGNVTGQSQPFRFRLDLTSDGGFSTSPTASVTVPVANPTPNPNTLSLPTFNTPDPNQQAANNGNGNGNGGNQNTPPPTTAPVPTTPPLAPGVLTANPSQLSFDANTDTLIIQLQNAGPSAVPWVIQQPTGGGANYLAISPASGLIQAGSGQAVTVHLAAFNQTGKQLNANMTVSFNNGAGSLPINITIAPQPPAEVQFVSPAPGPLPALGGPVPIKLQVQTQAQQPPTYARFKVKYSDQLGQPPTDHVIDGQATPANDWTVIWQMPVLLPQTGMEIDGTICATSDTSTCTDIKPPLTNLSVPKPGATINLIPNSTTLGSQVTLSATITGTVQHISYQVTYKDVNGQATTAVLPTQATIQNLYQINWDTTQIPPQTGITLAAKVCWDATESDATCTAPVNQLPTSLTIPSPLMKIGTVSFDISNLPASVPLNGTVTNLTNSASKGYIVVHAQKQASQTSQAQDYYYPVQFASSTTWQVAIDTSSWPPQDSITFTPWVCWDGSVPPLNDAQPTDFPFCFKGTALQGGVIADLTVTPNPNSWPPAVSDLVNLPLVYNPANRVSFISYTVSSGQTSLALPSQSTLNGQGNLTLTVDTLKLGLKEGAAVNFVFQACSSKGYCGTPYNTADHNQQLTMPLTDVSSEAINGPLQSPRGSLSASQSLTLTIRSRGFTDIHFFVSSPSSTPINRKAVITSTPRQVYNSSQAGSKVVFTWDYSSLPPSSDYVLTYRICWTGQFGTSAGDEDNFDAQPVNCRDNKIPYTSTNSCASGNCQIVLGPSVNAFYINLDPNNINSAYSHPIVGDLSNGALRSSVSSVPYMPLLYNKANPGLVNVTLQAKVSGNLGANNATPLSYYLASVSPANLVTYTIQSNTVYVSTQNRYQTTILLDLVALQTAGADLNQDYVLYAVPNWQNSQATPPTSIPYPSGIESIHIRFVDTKLHLDPDNSGNNEIIAPIDPNRKQLLFMVRNRSTFALETNNGVPGRVYPFVSFVSNPRLSDLHPLPQPSLTKTPNSTFPFIGWQFYWDHTKDFDSNTQAKQQLDTNNPMKLYWQVCANNFTGDLQADPNNPYSDCWSSDPNSFDTSMDSRDGLMLGAAQLRMFNPTLGFGAPICCDTAFSSSPIITSSTFTATVAVHFGQVVSPTINIVAFSLNPNLDPNNYKYTLAADYTSITPAAGNDQNWVGWVYWPTSLDISNDGTKLPQMLSPSSNGAASTTPNLGYGVVYCIQLTSPNKSYCNDPNVNSPTPISPNWIGIARVIQPAVVTWRTPNGGSCQSSPWPSPLWQHTDSNNPYYYNSAITTTQSSTGCFDLKLFWGTQFTPDDPKTSSLGIGYACSFTNSTCAPNYFPATLLSQRNSQNLGASNALDYSGRLTLSLIGGSSPANSCLGTTTGACSAGFPQYLAHDNSSPDSGLIYMTFTDHIVGSSGESYNFTTFYRTYSYAP